MSSRHFWIGLILSILGLSSCRPSPETLAQWAIEGEDKKLLTTFVDELGPKFQDSLAQQLFHAATAQGRGTAVDEMTRALDSRASVLPKSRFDGISLAILKDPNLLKYQFGSTQSFAEGILLHKSTQADVALVQESYRVLAALNGQPAFFNQLQAYLAQMARDTRSNLTPISELLARLTLVSDPTLTAYLSNALAEVNKIQQASSDLVQGRQNSKTAQSNLESYQSAYNNSTSQGNPRELRLFLVDRFDGKEDMWQVGTPFQTVGILTTTVTKFTSKGWFSMHVRNLDDMEVKQNYSSKTVPHLIEISDPDWEQITAQASQVYLATLQVGRYREQISSAQNESDRAFADLERILSSPNAPTKSTDVAWVVGSAPE